MKESRRKFFVSQLNAILPMVRETMSLFGEYYLLCEEWESKNNELESIKNAIKHNKEISFSQEPEETETEKNIDLGLSTMNKKLEARKKMLEDMIPEYKQKINIIHDDIKFMEGFFAYQAAFWWKGFLKAADIQDEYLMELAYLMSGKIENGSDEFFDDDVTKTNFYTRLDAMYPQAKEFSLKVDYTREKFFKIFNS